MTNTSKQIDEIFELICEYGNICRAEYHGYNSSNEYLEQIRSKLLELSNVKDDHWILAEDGWRYRPARFHGPPNISKDIIVDVLTRSEQEADEHYNGWGTIDEFDWNFRYSSLDIIAYRLSEDVK